MQPPTTATTRVSGKHPSLLQCTGTAKTGERCTNPPIKGGHVCVLHGGGSPMAKHAAQKLLLSTIGPAIATLVEAMEACDYLGDPIWPVRVSAAKTLLSRAGVSEQAKLILEAPDSEADLSSKELADTLEQISRELRERTEKRLLSTSPPGTLITEDNGESWHPAA